MDRKNCFNFYPSRWLYNYDLKRCTFNAKGVLCDLICTLFFSEEKGIAITNGIPWTNEEIIIALGGHIKAKRGLEELIHKHIVSFECRGALCIKSLMQKPRIIKIKKERKLSKPKINNMIKELTLFPNHNFKSDDLLIIESDYKMPDNAIGKIVMGYKILKTGKENIYNRDWDARNWGRWVPHAKKLLDIFGGNLKKSLDYLEYFASEYNIKNLEWTLKTVVEKYDDGRPLNG